MKKIIGLVLALVLCLSLVPISAQAAAPSASFTGPTTVRSGNEITLTFSINGTGIQGFQGQFNYDESQVTLLRNEILVEDPWMVEFGKINVVGYDNYQTNPINSSTKIFTATFKVNQLDVGTVVRISMDNVIISDGTDTKLGDIAYSVTISAAQSTNNKLESLEISNAQLKPSFDPNTTSYTAEVPYSVSKLVISAKPADKATIKYSNPTLTPDAQTKVTITVTAESGAKKVYTIMVTRAQDPNYQPSSNNDLSGITVDGFMLSPGFTVTNTDYVIWLPYEVDKVTVKGTAADSKATVRVEGGNNLIAGQDNIIKIICVAENGDEKTYTVIAKRAPGHGEETKPTVPTDPPIPTEPPAPTTKPTLPTEPSSSTTQPTAPVTPPTEPTVTNKPTTQPTTSKPLPSTSTQGNIGNNNTDNDENKILLILIYVIIAIIALCGILVCVMFIVGMKSKGKYSKKKRSRRRR